MILCPSCGGENADGTRFCVRCGAGLAPVPEPGSWRADTDPRQESTTSAYPTGEYRPPTTPPGYQPPPAAPMTYQPQSYQQQTTAGGGQQMHPIIPALISFFFPGLGLIAVPNKAGLGIGIFVAHLVLTFIIAIITLGLCLLVYLPIASIVAAIHSWDESAKASNGQFQPILFK
ncbi:MAG TPA: hypothetical protein VF666_01475 [Pyrinomonadaceae bacterium]